MLLKLDYDPNNPIPLGENEGLGKYLEVEVLSMVKEDYFKEGSHNVWRQRAVIVINKYSKCENFDPVVPFLAIDYFDRFVSNSKTVPSVMSCRQHDLELLALCCLTIAWKMRDRNFIVTKFLEQTPDISIVSQEQLLNMELHILKGLDWHLRPVTPFCFVRYFEAKFHSTYGFRRRTINQMIIQSHRDISVKQFKPSVIAVSALLAASSFLYASRFPSFIDKICSEIIFEQEYVGACTAGMMNMCNELKLMIESAVPEDEYLPKKQVQAGNLSQQSAAADKLKQVAEEPSKQASDSSKMATYPRSKQVVPVPSEQAPETSRKDACAKLKQVVRELSEQAGGTSIEWVVVETPEQAVTERSQQGASEHSEHTEKLKQEAAHVERSEKASAESSEGSKQEATETSERSEQASAEKGDQAGDETADKSKHKVAETTQTSKEEGAQKSAQVAAESEQGAAEKSDERVASDDVGTISQRPGKEKMKEVEMTVVPKMAEEIRDRQLEFPLRWVTEEADADDFAIFSAMFEFQQPAPPAQVPPAANQGQQQGPLQEFCCCCSCCNPF